MNRNKLVPITRTLPQVMEMLEWGEMIVPDFKQDFHWSLEKQAEFLNSIGQQMPLDSFICWRTNLDVNKRFKFGQNQRPARELNAYVLNGTQRLVTLFKHLSKSDIPSAANQLVFDVEARKFKSLKEVRLQELFIPSQIILDSIELLRLQRKVNQPQFTKVSDQIAEIFRICYVQTMVLNSNDVEAVKEYVAKISR